MYNHEPGMPFVLPGHVKARRKALAKNLKRPIAEVNEKLDSGHKWCMKGKHWALEFTRESMNAAKRTCKDCWASTHPVQQTGPENK